jgi:hypothetical protein
MYAMCYVLYVHPFNPVVAHWENRHIAHCGIALVQISNFTYLPSPHFVQIKCTHSPSPKNPLRSNAAASFSNFIGWRQHSSTGFFVARVVGIIFTGVVHLNSSSTGPNLTLTSDGCSSANSPTFNRCLMLSGIVIFPRLSTERIYS